MNRYSVINCNRRINRVTVTSMHVGSSYLVLFGLSKMGQIPHTGLVGPKIWGSVSLLGRLTRVRRSYVLLLFFSIINVIIFCRTSNLQSLSKVCWANQKKLTQTYCSSLHNFYGLKSAKFGFNFRLHSPLSRPNFEIERRI